MEDKFLKCSIILEIGMFSMRTAPPTYHKPVLRVDPHPCWQAESFTVLFTFLLSLAVLFFSISLIPSSNKSNFKILLEFYEPNFVLGIFFAN